MNIFQDYSLSDREKMLQQTSPKKENRSYARNLSESEIEVERGRYAREAIDLQALKEDAKTSAKEFKTKIEGKQKMMDERLEFIKTGKKEVVGVLYGLPDHIAGRMMFYDKYGSFIESRVLTPDEMQGRISFNTADAANIVGGSVDIPVQNHDVIMGDGVASVLSPQLEIGEERKPIEHASFDDDLQDEQKDPAEPSTIASMWVDGEEMPTTDDEDVDPDDDEEEDEDEEEDIFPDNIK